MYLPCSSKQPICDFNTECAMFNWEYNWNNRKPSETVFSMFSHTRRMV